MTIDIQCTRCKHLISGFDLKCKAFDEIPFDIIDGTFIHNKIHPEQNNSIIFEAKEDALAEKIEKIHSILFQ